MFLIHSLTRNPRLALVLVVLVSAGSSSDLRGQTPKRQVTQHDVIPVLMLRCAACHGRQYQDGGLDVRTTASLLRGGESGPAVVPGDPENSLILKRILAEEMPPRKRLIEASVKPMGAGEIELLRTWIEAGAPEVPAESQTAGAVTSISEQDRQFWSFQPPGEVPVPVVQQAERVHNPVDAFILEKLEENGLRLSPEADRRALIRRAAFDLTGLPPEPDVVDAFVANNGSDAYEKMIETLLSSRRYGERWGGYWLDRAGYSDTEGERQQDILRPQAYRYRDYVIRAFNADKPYDRFLLEQIAGDELADYENAEEITPQIYDNLVATGFLRMAPDPTWYNVTGFVPNRLDVIADAIDVLGSAIMGLSVKCARCHEHKFDPIPQRDYYALAAIFKGAYDEHDWLKPNLSNPVDKDPKRYLFRYLPHVPAEELREWEVSVVKLKAEIASLKKALDELAVSIRSRYFEEGLAKLPESVRSDVRRAFDIEENERDDVQNYLIEKFEATRHPTDEQLKEFDEDYKTAAEHIVSLEKNHPPKPMIRALWDRGDPSPTYLLRRGNYLSPSRLVQPAALAVLSTSQFDIKPPWPGSEKTGRRLALAKWLVRPDHPLTARVMVNMIWKHHFRHGIVKTMDNFGHSGMLPTHPELLDWLAREFTRNGWSIKDMHRLIMTSSTYRQASTISAAHERLDLDNDLLSRFPMKRMEAEVLWDTLLFISENLDETPFGAANGVEVRPDGLVFAVGTDKGWRRSIYVEHNRKQNMTILECFDFPRANPNCLERHLSTVAPQALHLLNNETIYELMRSLSDRVNREVGTDPAEQIIRSYHLALGRSPTPDETRLAAETLNRLHQEWSKTESDPGREALASLCHVLINSAEFLYID